MAGIMQSSILDLLQRPGADPMTAAEIADALAVPGRGARKVERALRRMERDGLVATRHRNRYAPVGGATVIGPISISRSGDGFVGGTGTDNDVRVFRKNLGTALPGDTVIARMLPERGGIGRSARVVEIVERADHRIVGTLKTTGKFFYVVPMSPAYRSDFYVADAGETRLNDRVVLEFVEWRDRSVNPEGRIIEVLGPESEPSFDTVAVMRQYGLDADFSAEILREAADAAKQLDTPGRRTDLRDKHIFTIDPADARDFDDALSIETDRRGNRVLGVHIADVSHFVRPGTRLDNEARRRGNSVYFPDKVLPMLPEAISNGACSLVPGEDRLTVSVFMTIDPDGSVAATRTARTIIRSKLRLTYEQAMDALEVPEGKGCPATGMSPEEVQLLKDIGAVAVRFRERRMQAHALDLDMVEYDIIIAPDGTVADVRPIDYDLSHQLVEECMVAANEAVDAHLSRMGIPLVHRIHEPPARAKIEELIATLTELGYHPGNLQDRARLSAFLAELDDSPVAHQAKIAVLRSMSKAVYSHSARGHYGLAKEFYAHFTSPIRRYPDLVVHRILTDALAKRRTERYPADALARVSLECSATEQAAEEAERSLEEIKKYRFLQQELDAGRPGSRRAIVTKVLRFGMFVEVVDLQVQGLVHVSTLSPRRAVYSPSRETLKAGGTTYKAGTEVEVLVTGVDFEKRHVDFTLVGAPESKQRRRKR